MTPTPSRRTRGIQSDPRPRTTPPGTRRTAPLPADWQARREAVIERDGECKWMEDGYPCGSTERLEVDHTGAPDDHRLEVLRALCHWHHSRWTAKQARAARGELPSRERPRGQHPGLITDEERATARRRAGSDGGAPPEGVGGDPDVPPF